MPHGHAKGSEFERKIAKEIVKAYKPFGITQKDCWRSTLSGGHPRAAGDLEISERLAKIFPFCLEMKHRKRIHFENFLLAKKSEERRWLEQTLAGARKAKGTLPVLVMRANHMPIYAMVLDTVMTPPFNRMMPWKEFLDWAIRVIPRFPRVRRKK